MLSVKSEYEYSVVVLVHMMRLVGRVRSSRQEGKGHTNARNSQWSKKETGLLKHKIWIQIRGGVNEQLIDSDSVDEMNFVDEDNGDVG